MLKLFIKCPFIPPLKSVGFLGTMVKVKVNPGRELTASTQTQSKTKEYLSIYDAIGLN